MDNKELTAKMSDMKDFNIPSYNEIPDVGLFLEQVVKYVTEFLNPILTSPITPSMISNYVKKKIIPNPIKKLYYKEHIAYVIFTVTAKTVLSLENLQIFIEIQKNTYDTKTAYNYFREELTNTILTVLGEKSNEIKSSLPETKEKEMLKTTIIAIANKIYLEKYFESLK